MIANYLKAGLICLCALGMYNNSVAQTSGTPIKNICLLYTSQIKLRCAESAQGISSQISLR